MAKSIYSMACLILIVSAAAMQCAAAELPNIVIVYADDLGYGDLSCYNPKAAYQTPRLDQMAKGDVRFTDAHSPSPICSPPRYGLFPGTQTYRSTGRGGGACEGPGAACRRQGSRSRCADNGPFAQCTVAGIAGTEQGNRLHRKTTHRACPGYDGVRFSGCCCHASAPAGR